MIVIRMEIRWGKCPVKDQVEVGSSEESSGSAMCARRISPPLTSIALSILDQLCDSDMYQLKLSNHGIISTCYSCLQVPRLRFDYEDNFWPHHGDRKLFLQQERIFVNREALDHGLLASFRFKVSAAILWCHLLLLLTRGYTQQNVIASGTIPSHVSWAESRGPR